MRSPRPDVLLLCLALLAPASAAQPSPSPTPTPAPASAPAPTRDQVDAAAHALRELPTLTGREKQHRLRFKPEDKKPRPANPVPAWARWIGEFALWFGQAGRLFVGLLGAFALALLVVGALRWWRERRGTTGPESLNLPTHVRELDIRPETLPDDLGGAALALWQAGHGLAAMSLLYRGALSQLVHRHRVPIRASSTEGDCLRLAAARLPAPGQAYLEALVAAWRQTVYAGRLPADEQASSLCAGFGAGLALAGAR